MPQASNEESPEQIKSLQLDQDQDQMNQGQSESIALISNGDTYYVPLLDLVKKVGYNYDWDEEQKVYIVGDTDPIFEIKMDSNEVTKEEEPLTLPSNTVMIKGAPYVSLDGFEMLFNEELDYEVQGSKLILYPSAVADIPQEVDTTENIDDPSLNFGDDPEDPAEDEEVWIPLVQTEDDTEAEPALKNISITNMLKTANKYLGVKYKFGAKTYSSSNKRFDCSSFTKYVYGKYGVYLPRTARAQALKGTTVSRSKLRKGDLLYFYVPGRFKNEKTIGHVGIYIGNRKMIHSSPAPKDGVQISNIDNSYWKKTFIKAKRVAY